MKIQISVSAENAAFLMATEKFKFKASFNSVAPNGLIVLDVYFSPLADSETIASSFFMQECNALLIKSKKMIPIPAAGIVIDNVATVTPVVGIVSAPVETRSTCTPPEAVAAATEL